MFVYSGERERENKFTDDSVLLAQNTRWFLILSAVSLFAAGFVSSGEGHACKITGVDWSNDGLYLRSSGAEEDICLL